MEQKEVIQKNRIKNNRKSFILALVFCLGVGFAALSSQLTITGNTSVKGQTWSVYLDNIHVTPGSISSEEPTISESGDSVEYTVDLELPGDYYEFTVDAVNDGTLDVAVSNVSLTGISPAVAAYFTYELSYADGSSVGANDILRADTTRTYRVLVKYRDDIQSSALSSTDTDLSLSFTVNFGQYDSRGDVSEFTKLVRSNALSDENIDFTTYSSISNGRGLYLRTGTENQKYPIYYYRGAVTNNNAKFAGFCWKIVRTTETGGTKLVYNGEPDGNGECTNTTGSTTNIGSSTFNEASNSPAYVGYMYGEIYEYHNEINRSSSYSYGSDFEFVDVDDEVSGDGTYTLTNPVTDTSQINTHHYTCFNASGTCSELYYIYFLDSETTYYIALKDGKSIEDAMREMQTNEHNSVVKTAIDDWFENTFNQYFTNVRDYENYLEDTVWCNDRSMNTLEIDEEEMWWYGSSFVNNGWKSNGGGTDNYLWYGAYGRQNVGTPSLICPNKNDSFTVTESAIGNGALDYPVGLLTVDELMLSGEGHVSTHDGYLYNNTQYWTMSPYQFTQYIAVASQMGYYGGLANASVEWGAPVRPSISLKPSVRIATGGDGSSATPYEFIVE